MDEHDSDSRDLDREIRAIFPDVDLSSPLKHLGSGFRSTVLVDAGDVIYRLSRSLEAAHLHSAEVLLLDVLGPRLPFAVPEAEYRPGHGSFPFGAMRYRRLNGAPLELDMLDDLDGEVLASEIVVLLIALRAIPQDSLDSLPLPTPSAIHAAQRGLRDATLPALAGVLTPGEFEIVETWWKAFMTDNALLEYVPTFIHGDLWYENLLVDPASSTLMGVLDWEDAAIGDPAQDVAALLHLGPRFVRDVMDGMDRCDLLDPTFEYRVHRHWEMREFVGIEHAMKRGDSDEFLDGVRKLRAGPLFDAPDRTRAWE